MEQGTTSHGTMDGGAIDVESGPQSAAMPAGSTQPAPRAKRSDARRNHDLLLATAADVFAERGIEASLEEIARRANVGIGTLYRHFPSRDALNEAVYRREVETLCDEVTVLLASLPPDEALITWMGMFTGYVARKRGMAVALKSALGPDNELFSYSHRRIREAIACLVGAAARAGTIRDDVDPEDLLRAVSGICMATDSPGWSDGAQRLVNLLMDGLRYGAAARGTGDQHSGAARGSH